MKIGLFVGDVHAAPVEVICTSTNPMLNVMAGSGGKVLAKGGPELRQACDTLIEREQIRTGRDQLPPGTAAATGPGQLSFQAVIHCVALDSYHASNPDIISTCVQNALATITGLKPRPKSAAMPVFAADNKKYDFSAALRAMFEVLYAERAQPIDDLWIAVKDDQQAGAARRLIELRMGEVEVHKPVNT